MGGDGTGWLVHGKGVPILFPSQKTRGSPSSGKLIDLCKDEVSAGRIVKTEHNPREQPPSPALRNASGLPRFLI
jgi:hypothetical protein